MRNRKMMGLGIFAAVVLTITLIDVIEVPLADPLIDSATSYLARSPAYLVSFVKLLLLDGPIYVLEKTSYLGVFTLMTMESASLPVPSELVLPYAGFLAFEGYLGLVQGILISTVASLVGSLIDYWLGAVVGRPAVLRIGKYIGIREETLARAENWFNTKGKLAVLIARFVPGLRSIISIPAGVARMNMSEFLLYTAIGSSAWNAGLMLLGYYLGQNWTVAYGFFRSTYTMAALAITVVAVAVYLASIKLRRQSQ